MGVGMSDAIKLLNFVKGADAQAKKPLWVIRE